MSEYELKRKIVHGILNLLLGTLAAWLANKITDSIVGQPPVGELTD